VADPQRLLDDPDASPLARSLLASAEEDAPSSRQRAAVAKRLGIAAGLLAGTSEVGAGAVAGAGALWWKIGIVVAVLGGAITGGVALLREAEPAAEVAATTTAPARAPIQAPARATLEPPPAPEPPAPAIEPPPTPPTPAALPAKPTPPSPATAKAKAKAKAIPPPAPEAIPPPAPEAAPAPPPAAPIDARRLAAEVAVLDRARAALRRGDADAATAALDEHARDFADGALGAEAEVVRIEALVHAGQADAARERARAFLARFPQSPLAKRLRSLALRLPTPAKETP
jgi:outer membrane biosynthesis protein TonB